MNYGIKYIKSFSEQDVDYYEKSWGKQAGWVRTSRGWERWDNDETKVEDINTAFRLRDDPNRGYAYLELVVEERPEQ